MDEGKIISSSVILSKANPAESADEVMNTALTQAGLTLDDIHYSVGTGYGKEQISFVKRMESEISCHAKGAWWDTPSVRTVIDIGGQDAKAIRIDDTGKVIRYAYNDKCASGTGRFLEVMADALEVEIEEMGAIGKQAKEKVTISNQCVIFAETEVISLINEGKEVSNIVNGLHHAMANRVASLARSIGVEQDVVMTGGVAKNNGMFDALVKGLTFPVKALDHVDPQINGALGAALFAEEFLQSA
jgi:predicted CoA-substrate-specific enzyme activase